MAIGDTELVAASLDGDRSAFAELVDRHQPRVRAVVRRLLGDQFDVEDVVQEAILQSYLGLAELRDPTRFGSWLAGIAVNLAKMRLRRARTVRLATGGDSVVLDWAAGPTPEEALEAAELLGLVQDAVALLPPGEREAVLMHYVDGLSCQEIAALVGQSTGAVRVRLHRARKRLRHRLASLQPQHREEIVMVEVEIEDVITRVLPPEEGETVPRLAFERLRIVLLREKGGERVLPIWIGSDEGDALALQIAGEALPRPLTADLTARIVEATGARVERVAVASLREKTFYAVVSVSAPGGSREIDARPSDAINLAARVGAPIFVDRGVFDDAARPAGELPAFLDDEEEAFFGAARGGEWEPFSPALVRALKEPPRREP
jgi:RNA polymerase sigma factor (sigma-70 family)